MKQVTWQDTACWCSEMMCSVGNLVAICVLLHSQRLLSLVEQVASLLGFHSACPWSHIGMVTTWGQMTLGACRQLGVRPLTGSDKVMCQCLVHAGCHWVAQQVAGPASPSNLHFEDIDCCIDPHLNDNQCSDCPGFQRPKRQTLPQPRHSFFSHDYPHAFFNVCIAGFTWIAAWSQGHLTGGDQALKSKYQQSIRLVHSAHLDDILPHVFVTSAKPCRSCRMINISGQLMACYNEAVKP